ncbi:MAG TPA: peptidoglycan-binding domain-containing protein [Nitrospira sp.]|nr:peptidoglycan-binding domain-containing protein [Nitrospira sp.]
MGIGDGHDLNSPRFRGDSVLEDCLDGEHRMLAGQIGPAVEKVQRALRDLGFINEKPDGIYGQRTSDAVVRFKEFHHILPSDAVVGPKTMAALDIAIIAFDAQHGAPDVPPSAPVPILHTVTFWINAFIPDPSGTTYVLPAPGISTGLSMIVVPSLSEHSPIPRTRAFLGDNRGFSSNVMASSRIHSLVQITNVETETPQIQSADNHCGASHEIDMESGKIIATATAPATRIRFLNLRGNTTIDPNGGVLVDSPNPHFIQIDYEAAANLPLLSFSPDIDMVGTLGIDRDNRTFRFRGSVDGFPAFEAYASFNLGAPVAVFQLSPVNPFELVGDVKRAVDITVPIGL